MNKYIDAEQLKAEIERFNSLVPYENNDRHDEGLHDAYKAVKNVIPSLQQEPTPDTDVLHTKLINLLKTHRIGEETAITLADRIADAYGTQRYMDGLCDGIKQEKQKQQEVDLEKEIKDTCRCYRINDYHEQELGKHDIENIAHYFYELGLNTRN